jgi:hypothetical protein
MSAAITARTVRRAGAYRRNCTKPNPHSSALRFAFRHRLSRVRLETRLAALNVVLSGSYDASRRTRRTAPMADEVLYRGEEVFPQCLQTADSSCFQSYCF